MLLLAILAWHAEAIAAPRTLTWVNPVTDNATGVSVERSTGGTGPFAQIATTGPTVTTYVDSSATDGITYCYRVRAFNPNGYSAYSNTACSSPGDVTPPTVSITAPTGGTVSGNVTVRASATDNVGVTLIKYYVDGALIGVFAPPVYSLVWNTALVPNGTHTLTVKATDAAGNTGTSAAVTVTVANPSPVPVLSTLAPSSALQGGPVFTLTVTGSGFVSASTVRWNGSSRTTTFVSTTQLRAAIPASDLVTAGTAQVTVFNPVAGGAAGNISNALPFAITTVNPVPVLSTLTPTSALQGGPAFTLTVTGSGFVSSSTVRWNGVNRTTTVVSATQLTASIPASDLVTAGTAQVTVFSPAPGGGTSSARSFTVTAGNPLPVLSALAPSSALQGGPAFTLTVTGSGFVSGSTVRWNSVNRTTTFVSATQLRAAIPASDLVTAGTAQVTVFTPTPGGGTSSALAFTVTAINPVPTLSTLAPSSALQDGPAFTLTVTGSGFVPTSLVQWNGSNRTTTFVSATQLRATILAADLASIPGAFPGPRTANVTVFTPTPGGGTSSALSFTITGM
ncbi:MAG TPA: Ig-like domain-containing protein [Gemmatimonadales bacterium]|nr:Ig-like domain-containing protein [Gemmatimonadales bacterium]